MIYVSTPIKTCIKRDPKGLYKKSNAGLIKDLTGIGSKFEVPENYDFIIDTSETNKKDALVLLKNFVRVKQKK